MCDDEDSRAMVGECTVGKVVGGEGVEVEAVLYACSVFWRCVTLSKSLYLTDPLFPHCKMETCFSSAGWLSVEQHMGDESPEQGLGRRGFQI